MRIVCLADTHGLHDGLEVPDGDLLIHAGDLTGCGSREDVAAFDSFLARLPHRHKVVVAGNHDFAFEREPEAARALIGHAAYLQDSGVEAGGLRIYGSPWQPWFYDWAFNLRRGPELRAKWDLIPAGVDILVTHGPPLGHGDRILEGSPAGCADLLEAVRRLGPRLHVFGHIHEGYGVTREAATLLVNASNCDAAYRPVNKPVVLELDGGGVRLIEPSPRL